MTFFSIFCDCDSLNFYECGLFACPFSLYTYFILIALFQWNSSLSLILVAIVLRLYVITSIVGNTFNLILTCCVSNF